MIRPETTPPALAPSLRNLSPTAADEDIVQLAAVLEKIATRQIDIPTAESQIGSLPRLTSLLRELAGRRATAGTIAVAFGQGNSFGDIAIENVVGGDFVNLKITLVVGQEAYRVAGLINPFLGLSPFTHAEHSRFAGRARLVALNLARLTTPGEQQRLLFVTGASGSGKSSFVQAGLLPALDTYYRKQGQLRYVVVRPYRHPWAACIDGLARLAGERPLILVIDQLEELFTQADPGEAEQLLAWLEGLENEPNAPEHVICTIRDDYLHRLIQRSGLEQAARKAALVSAMDEGELCEAIVQPVRALHPNKAIDPDLVVRLARDATGEAAYLPLLQVTLEDLWRGGLMTLGRYDGLHEAISRRAELVLSFSDHEGERRIQRSAHEQSLIMEIFAELVAVSPDSDARRDVRRSLERARLTRSDPLRERLVDELVVARLLRQESEPRGDRQVVLIDVIHERLISEWQRLRNAIDEQRARLQERERFLSAFRVWRDSGCRDDDLLIGGPLARAEELERQGALHGEEEEANVFLRRSRAHAATQREHERRRSRTNRLLVGGLVIVVLTMGVIFAFARLLASERDKAIQAEKTAVQAEKTAVQAGKEAEQAQLVADSQRLALQAIDQLDEDPELALLLSGEAMALDQNPITERAARQALFLPRRDVQLIGHTASLESAEFNPAGDLVVTAGSDRTARVFRIDGTPVVTLRGHTGGAVHSAFFSPDGQHILTAASDGARIWRLDGSQEAELVTTSGLWYAVFSPDGTQVLTAQSNGTAVLWDVASRKQIRSFIHPRVEGRRADIRRVAFSADGRLALTASFDKTARVWPINDFTESLSLQHEDSVNTAQLQPGPGKLILTGANDKTARLWKLDGTPVISVTHDAPVWDARFSPDGQSFITALSDGTFHVWSLTGELLLTFKAHDRAVPGISFGSEGRLLTASGDGSARLWQLVRNEGGNLEAKAGLVYRGHTGPLRDITFSPDGTQLLTAGDDGTARLWTEKGVQLREFAHGGTVYSAAFDCTGSRIVTAGSDNTAWIWDATSGQKVKQLKGHSDDVRRAVFHPNCTDPEFDLVLTAANDGTARLWRSDGTEVISITHDPVAESPVQVTSVAFHPSQKLILTASNSNTARLWRFDGTAVATFEGHNGGILSAVFDKDGEKVLTASTDGTLRVWGLDGTLFLTIGGAVEEQGSVSDVIEEAVYSADGKILSGSRARDARLWDGNGRLLRVFPIPNPDEVRAVTFRPTDDEVNSSRTVAIATRDGLALVWTVDAPPIPTLATISYDCCRITSAVYSPDEQMILTAGGDDKAKLWSRSGVLKTEYKGHSGDVRSAVFDPDGRYVLTASDDKTVRLWDLDGTEIVSFTYKSALSEASFSPDGKLVLTATVSGTVELWDRDESSNRILTSYSEQVYSASFSADGQEIVVGLADQTARVLSLDGKERLVLAGHAGGVYDAAFSPDGKYLLTASWDDTARLWNRSGQVVQVFRHNRDVRRAAFHPGGEMIVTASSDGTARLWQLNGTQISILAGHTSGVDMASFSATGDYIVTASGDQSARQHAVKSVDVLNLLACRASRPLDVVELDRFQVTEQHLASTAHCPTTSGN